MTVFDSHRKKLPGNYAHLVILVGHEQLLRVAITLFENPLGRKNTAIAALLFVGWFGVVHIQGSDGK